MTEQVLLGDEAVGLGALHAGVSFAYGYPGTPSTEIIEYMQDVLEKGTAGLFSGTGEAGLASGADSAAAATSPATPEAAAEAESGATAGAETDVEPDPKALWCSNEKTALESAVGVSALGRRVLVTMKHVGLNVAADPFMNSVLMKIKGGLVIAVADDPGMHSSQNEQDSRWFADFAKVPCLEPADQQEAYLMCRYAFDLSEELHLPVLLKLVTRLSHSRAVVRPEAPRNRNRMEKFTGKTDFMVLPGVSRKNYAEHLKLMDYLGRISDESEFNPLCLGGSERPVDLKAERLSCGEETSKNSVAEAYRAGVAGDRAAPFAVITSGLGRGYYLENLPDLDVTPDHLHVGFYPLPVDKIRRLAGRARRVICIEEGYPYVERLLKGLMPMELQVSGKLDGTVIPSGELNPDNVRVALGLEPLKMHDGAPGALGPGAAGGVSFDLPGRPPQLCQGCPHIDTYRALNEVMEGYEEKLVTSDIGCYTLGFLSPYEAIETSLCMGASIPMARGAAEAGLFPVVATIGDSTFMHSGLTGLADLVGSKLPVTLFILDNHTTAMTGGQDTICSSDRIKEAVLGLGVEPEHCVEFTPLPKHHDENVEVIRREVEYRGVSVIIPRRECVQTLKRSYAKAREEKR